MGHMADGKPIPCDKVRLGQIVQDMPWSKIAWLQEITLTMNPTDPSIVQHVPKVLRQLVSNVNQRLTMEGHGGQFRRLLQMLLNSLMGMQLQLGN